MSTSSIQIFRYNGSPITFNNADSVMVNATEMAKPFGKRTNDFLSSKSTQELISSLSAKTGISATGLVVVNQGGNNQGTWLHEDLALIFAQWLSPDFYLWCNDRIKELLTTGSTSLQPRTPQTYLEALEALVASEKEKETLRIESEQRQKQIEQKDKAITRLQPKADFADAAFKAEGKVDIGQAAKILGLPFGRNTLFKKLKEAGVFFANRNEPKQKYIEAGYFEMTLLPPIHRDNHPDIMYQKVLCNPKGLALINMMFGGNPPENKLSPIM